MSNDDKRVINNLNELCDYIGVSSPSELNRAIYKGTACGASLSAYSGKEGEAQELVWDFCIVWDRDQKGDSKLRVKVRHGADTPIYEWLNPEFHPQELLDYFDLGPEHWDAVMEEERHTWRQWGRRYRDTESQELHYERYGQVTLKVMVPRRAWHCGDDWSEVDENPEMISSVTIQSIVEGSEATVDSDYFNFPVEVETFEKWFDHMEKETSLQWGNIEKLTGEYK